MATFEGAWDLSDPNSATWNWIRETYGQVPRLEQNGFLYAGDGPREWLSPLNHYQFGDFRYGGGGNELLTDPKYRSQMATLAEAIYASYLQDPSFDVAGALRSANLTPEQAQELQFYINGISTRIQDKPEQNKTLLSKIATNPLTYILPAVGGIVAAAGGAGAAGGASAGGTAAAEAGAAGGLESFVGPATGTVEAAPVIGAGGAPTVSAVASGAGPFVPVVAGMTGPSNALSQILSPSSASGGGTASTVTSSTAISRILSGNGTAADFLEVAGRAAPGIISAVGSNQQANSLERLADQYMAMGAPSRGRFEASFAPGFTMASDPGYKDALDQTTKSFLHKASIAGNPAESPNAWQQTLKDVNASFAYPALQNYRSINANAGGLATFAPAAVDASGSAIGAQGRVFSDLGSAAGDVFSPPKSGAQSLAEILRSLR